MEVMPQIEPQSLADLTAMVDRAIKETGRSADDAVSYAALFVAKAGKRDAKKGKKNRESISNPLWEQTKWALRNKKRGRTLSNQDQALISSDKPPSPFLIVRHRQSSKKPLLLPSYEKKDTRRVIERIELSNKTWGVMVGKAGALKGGTNQVSSGRRYKVAKYEEKLGDSAGSTVVRLVNKLTYQEDAYPGITNRAVREGTLALGRKLDNRLNEMARRANR